MPRERRTADVIIARVQSCVVRTLVQHVEITHPNTLACCFYLIPQPIGIDSARGASRAIT